MNMPKVKLQKVHAAIAAAGWEFRPGDWHKDGVTAALCYRAPMWDDNLDEAAEAWLQPARRTPNLNSVFLADRMPSLPPRIPVLVDGNFEGEFADALATQVIEDLAREIPEVVVIGLTEQDQP